MSSMVSCSATVSWSKTYEHGSGAWVGGRSGRAVAVVQWRAQHLVLLGHLLHVGGEELVDALLGGLRALASVQRKGEGDAEEQQHAGRVSSNLKLVIRRVVVSSRNIGRKQGDQNGAHAVV